MILGRQYPWFRYRILLAEDGGAGDGGDGSGDDTAPSGDSDSGEKEPFDPSTKLDVKVKSKYLTQFPKKLQEQFKDDDFRGIENVEDLYVAYKGLKEQQKNALVIPTEKSSNEEIKDFFRKVGMPEEPNGYECMKFPDMSDTYYTPMRDNFREAAYSCGLSKGQAKRMWTNMAATVQSFVNVANSKADELKKNYDTRYSSLLEKDIPDETRRKAKIEEEKNSARAFGNATGLSEFFEATGLSYNPEFTHKLAEWYAKIQPMSIFSDPHPGKEDKGLVGIYKH